MNYYTSVDVSIDCIGNMRRIWVNLPKEIKMKKHHKGENIALCRCKQMILKWWVKRELFMDSSMHHDSKKEVRTKKLKVS